MPTLLIVFLTLGGGIMAFCLFMLRRNGQVYGEKRRVLDEVSALNLADMKETFSNGVTPALLDALDRRTRARLAYYSAVSYKKMLNQFWRPVGSFYDGAIPHSKSEEWPDRIEA